VQLVNSNTISGLALVIFLTKYYKNKTIPSITDNLVYEDIKKAHYGGQTEVYRPVGENLYYYDVNSLYPYSCLNDLTGCEATYYQVINEDINNLFGFFEVEVEAPDNLYVGVLPFKRKDGTIYPLGKFSG